MPTSEEMRDAAELVAWPLHGTGPSLTGTDLVQSVLAFQPPAETVACWYMSQASVIWKGGGQTAWIDPYLRVDGRRRYPPLCRPEEITGADLVLITHEHSDHLDPTTCAGIATASPSAVFVAPPICEAPLVAAGVPKARIRTPRTGETLRVGNWRVVPTPAAHEEVDIIPGMGHRFVGYIAEVDGMLLYHAGDTMACDELAAALLPFVDRLDLAMLPINGRDYFRRSKNILGNFTFREAAELAMRLGPGVTVPLHFDLFRGNNDEWPGHFVDYLHDRAPYLPIAVLAPGQRLLVTRR